MIITSEDLLKWAPRDFYNWANDGYVLGFDKNMQQANAIAEFAGRLSGRRDLLANELDSLAKEAGAFRDSYCLAEGHSHQHRASEAMCSLRFQLAQARAEVRALKDQIAGALT